MQQWVANRITGCITEQKMVATETAISQIRSAGNNRQLVVVMGTGVSLALTGAQNPNLSWKGLVENGFEYGVAKGKISPRQALSWRHQLDSSDLDDLLSAAEFMGHKLGAPDGVLYARWLENVFRDVKPEGKGMANAIHALSSAGIPICTLNYDLLLERVTGRHSINLHETRRVIAWMRGDEQGILHLHGTWDTPSSCVLGIRDYERTLNNEFRDLIQRALTSFGRLLFIGCGDTFADPNFSALIKWLRDIIRTGAAQHYALVNASDQARRDADESWHGFVEPLSYGDSHLDLPAFLLNLFPTKLPTPSIGKTKRPPKLSSISPAKRERILADYRAFLINDCGQMTIEGVRADMDTAQRRFDLEKLFVPLTLMALPPEISNSDPDRDQKLNKWQEDNKGTINFGEAFDKSRRIALLALPGGGKTLLLKRLAVAYADPRRLTKSGDGLPKLDLLPVLIRCREWKEHIQKPIPILLQNIASITGQLSLTEFWDALKPLLKKGYVLLLVDGLDEIHDDAARSTFVANLESFLSEHRTIRLVVTSREAGFGLVAPSLARFCNRWRVATLEDKSIRMLCDYWHSLMAGDGSASALESQEVAERILHNAALRRLAENPLLLQILDEGREKIDQIRRYAKDTPHEFLKRVELRSGLLVEAGHQLEGALTVPFYQFRHLTFQEHLAAVAASQGYYIGYEKNDSILSPLRNHLDSEEWKEVVPMAAVLAGRQAEPLMSALVVKGTQLRNEMVRGDLQIGSNKWEPQKLPRAVARLFQCLAEEAQASPEVLTPALQIIALFARGCQSADNWLQLIRGPYGSDLLHQAWNLYAPMDWPKESWIRNTIAVICANARPFNEWDSDQAKSDLIAMLHGNDDEKIGLALLTVAGFYWHGFSPSLPKVALKNTEWVPVDLLEKHILSEVESIWHAATWAWGLSRKDRSTATSPDVLDRILQHWLDRSEKDPGISAFALDANTGVNRNDWIPKMSEVQKDFIRRVGATPPKQHLIDERYAYGAALNVAFHAKDVWADDVLAAKFSALREIDGPNQARIDRIDRILTQLKL